MILPSIQTVRTGVSRVAARFPFVLLMALILFVIAVLQIHEIGNNEKEGIRLLLIAGLGISTQFAIALFSERVHVSKGLSSVLSLLGYSTLVVLYIILPGAEDKFLWAILFSLAVAVHMKVSFIAFGKDASHQVFWKFNIKLFQRILVAALFTGTLFIGCAGALASIDVLFHVNVDEKVYGDIFAFFSIIFSTIFFLAGVPVVDEEYLETEGEYPKGLKVFSQYVLLPLVVLYLAIMYVYTVKVLLITEWPSGIIGHMVLWYGILGILALLLLYPLETTSENQWIRAWGKWYYRALIPLTLVLGVAISKRISEYGVTEERYAVAVLAVWLFCISVYFAFSKNRNIKSIPISLATIAFLITIGPWGMVSVSVNSQVNELEGLLRKHKLLKSNLIHSRNFEMIGTDYDRIESIAYYLETRGGTASSVFQEKFVRRIDTSVLGQTQVSAYTFLDVLSVDKKISDEEEKYTTTMFGLSSIRDNSKTTTDVSISNYSYFFTFPEDLIISKSDSSKIITTSGYVVGYNRETGKAYVTSADSSTTFEFDVVGHCKYIAEHEDRRDSVQNMYIQTTSTNGNGKSALLVLQSITMSGSKNNPEIYNADMLVFVQ